MHYTNVSACTLFPGNTLACVERANGASLVHQALLGRAVNYDGDAHHSLISTKAQEKIRRAMLARRVEAWFPVVGDEIAGASIEYATVLTKWNGKEFVHYAAIYGEDTSVFADISKAFRERTKWAENPKGTGLGTWFEEERIRHWTQNAALEAPFGLVPAARIGEYSAHSAAMIAIFEKLKATRGTERQGIVEVDGRDVSPERPVTVYTGEYFSPDGKSLDHIFYTSWSSPDGEQQICASFTEGISTFTGDPVIRVQITSNGNVPDDTILLKNVLDSLLAAGQKEIDEYRKWGVDQPIIQNKNPLIRLGGFDGEWQASAFLQCGEGLTQRIRPPEATPVSLMRIHSFDECIVKALPGHSRLLGPHPTMPVVVDFADIPQNLLGMIVPPAKPLIVISAMPHSVALH